MPEIAMEPAVLANAASFDEAHEHQQRGTRQLLLARVCFFASAYVVSAILARKLGAIDYGVYGVVISVLFWLEMLVRAGVPGATAKLIADGRYDHCEIERSVRALLLGLSVSLFAVCWFLASQVASLMRIPNGEALLRIAIIDLPFAAIYASYEGIFYGHRRFGVIAVAQVLYAMSKVGGILALTSLGFSLEQVLVMNVLSTCVVCGVVTVWYRPDGFRPMPRIVAEITTIAAPMALYLFATQILMNLDLWSLNSLWKGDGEVVGQYFASMNLAKILSVIPAAQTGVLFTSVAWAVASCNMARARRHIHEASRFAVLTATAAFVILGLNGSEVLSVLFSKTYAEGHRFLPLQLAAFGLFALLDIFSHSLIAVGRQYLTAGALTATVPLVWLSNYLLIPRLGPVGAAASMLLGMAIGTALTGAMAYRYFGALVRFSTVIRVLVAAVVVGMASVAITVRGPLVIFKAAMLGGLYLIILYILKEITVRDFGFSTRSDPDVPGEKIRGT